ncbi:hypothetical protein E2P81_ATG07854 [Venturia nashicola]|uniref:Uncharacterized protein n=1 Tax=Venturia nashicola TaxID=86259 RepID=A0A4Z1NRJ4_9PEZI|nr:hypothetical protein E6O75_ATG08025 [Venturia nashicola]TLD22661.1 hypothetical protein E2P81_ATG07854 [Venturia nashicola]
MPDQVLGTIPPPSPGFSNAEQRQHGEDFLPKLTKCGAIANDESFEPNTLEIPIHPILAKENWEPTQLGELWTDIQPAQQLASHFLTEPGCIRFWAKLIYGNIVYGPKIIIGNPQYTPEMLQDTKAVLEKLAQNEAEFRFGDYASS